MPSSVDQLLDEAQAAADEGRFEPALRHAEQVLAQQPADPEALELKALALLELGRIDEADLTYRTLLKAAPDEPGALLSVADALIRYPGDDPERIADGLRLLEPLRKTKDEDLRFEVLLLLATGLNQLGDAPAAQRAAEQALQLEPRNVDARLERAFALFEQAHFSQARDEYQALSLEVPEDPSAWYHLGLIAERAGRAEAEGLFKAARDADPDAYPEPVRLPEARFDQAVQDAIAHLPEQARAELGNVTIAVEAIPSDDDLDGGRLSATMLGIFHGTPVDERSSLSAADHQTAVIKLFQNNLQRFARTEAELIEQIGVTLLHEVGHLMGLDEDELADRGLD